VLVRWIRVWVCLVRAYEIGRRLQTPYFAGGILSIFGGFLNISVNFDRFLGLIFPFWAHFQFRDTVYKRRESEADVLPIGDTTLGITSVRNRCQKILILGTFLPSTCTLLSGHRPESRPSYGLPTKNTSDGAEGITRRRIANRLEDERVSRDVASLTPILAISKILTWPILRA
jgi:hypothetical protein